MSNEIKNTVSADRYRELIRHARVCESIRAKGITYRIERRLVDITDPVYAYRGHGKELIGGKCHYRNAVEVSGNTYPIKEILKSYGFRWDATEKVWYNAPSFNKYGEMAEKILRHLAA